MLETVTSTTRGRAGLEVEVARIYIADDEPDIRNLLTFTLVDEGHEVLTVPDGAKAVAAVAEDPPDLLVLDLMMPVMDGFQVLDELEARGVRALTRVLMLTARRTEKDRLEGLQHGADLYISKPFDTDELLVAVHDLLGTSHQELEAMKEKERDTTSLLVQLESVFGP